MSMRNLCYELKGGSAAAGVWAFWERGDAERVLLLINKIIRFSSAS